MTGIAMGVIVCTACGPTAGEQPPDLPSAEGARYASTLCEAIEACRCGQKFESLAACESEYQLRFDALLRDGFEVSSECFEAWVADRDADPCDQDTPPPGAPFPCAQLHGDGKKGAACNNGIELGPLGTNVSPLRVDECDEGLSCLYNRCDETPSANDSNPGWEEFSEGEACGATYLVGFCSADDNLYCDFAEGVCRTRTALGAECSPGSCATCSGGAARPLYCHGASTGGSGVCAAMPGIGEPCDPLDVVVCGDCENVGWCDGFTSTCVGERAPRLCTQVSFPGF